MKSARKRFVLTAAAVLAVGVVVAVLVPVSSGAWPWDDNRQIHVTGQVNCNDFDASLDSRIPFARVEGFEIRGRSDVLHQAGNGYAATYAVDVPPGWKVEWSVKCSSSTKWQSGSFDISKTGWGTSYSQTRHVCVGGGPFEPCVPREFGACITALFSGVLPSTPTFEDAFGVLYDAYGDDHPSTDIEDCARTLRDATPDLNSQPRPTEQPTVAPTTNPTHTPESTLGPEPTPRSSSGPSKHSTPIPPPATQPAPPATRAIRVYDKVTNGMSMSEDTPAYLSTVTQNYCRRDGCMLAGTEVGTGAVLTATCQTFGARTTNGNDGSAVDDANPELFSSTRWYGVRWSDGRFGYISEVWINAADRGGLGLPGC
jgi:hypothetical protein